MIKLENIITNGEPLEETLNDFISKKYVLVKTLPAKMINPFALDTDRISIFAKYINTKLDILSLEKCFEDAKKLNKKFIGVKIQMQGFEKPEVIINERNNFDTKLEYYKKAYDEDLTLKTFNGIKIINFTYGDNFEEIYHNLKCPFINV